jgi:hypothetical protein
MFYRCTRVAAQLALLTATVACSESPSVPTVDECDVANLALTVGAGSSPILDWDPACPIALLLIEPVGEPDAWQIRSREWDDDAEAPTLAWNSILPPITYGHTPSGAEPVDYIPAEALVTGDYTFAVFRMLTSGATVIRDGVPFTIR